MLPQEDRPVMIGQILSPKVKLSALNETAEIFPVPLLDPEDETKAVYMAYATGIRLTNDSDTAAEITLLNGDVIVDRLVGANAIAAGEVGMLLDFDYFMQAGQTLTLRLDTALTGGELHAIVTKGGIG